MAVAAYPTPTGLLAAVAVPVLLGPTLQGQIVVRAVRALRPVSPGLLFSTRVAVVAVHMRQTASLAVAVPVVVARVLRMAQLMVRQVQPTEGPVVVVQVDVTVSTTQQVVTAVLASSSSAMPLRLSLQLAVQ